MSKANENWKHLIERDPLETDEVNMDRLQNQGCGNPFGGKPHVWPKYSGQVFTMHKANVLAREPDSDEDSVIPDTYQDFKTSLNGRAKVRLVRKQLDRYLSNHPQIPAFGRVLLLPSKSMTFSQVKNSDIHYWKNRNDFISKLSIKVHKPQDSCSRESSMDRSTSSLEDLEPRKKPLLDLPYTSIRTRLLRLLNKKGIFKSNTLDFKQEEISKEIKATLSSSMSLPDKKRLLTEISQMALHFRRPLLSSLILQLELSLE